MTELVELGDGLQVYTQSVLEAQYIYDEIFQQGCYSGVELPDRPLVFDIGGNIGMFVLYIKNKYPDAEVVSFEPMPDSIELFGKNMDLHGLGDVTLHRTALGSTAESGVTFSFFPMLPANSTRYPEIKEQPKDQMAQKVDRALVDQMYYAQEVTVDVQRLAAFLPTDRDIDLLKVDVEGAEADVLLGIDASQWPRIRRAVVEVADLDDQLERVCAILRDNGFKVDPQRAPLTDEADRYFMVHATRD
ncbi:FkbM family methyltransferase [Streptomyces kunmingensis]|uniref:FkbM family methyltransferase n=1 Tax=Streptomyces kunmingensis TaxID=68225 RepID=A0ABU6C3A9_9ACTN|nr:FkbM family methyltransferase [Streptomyces kunmingensis]MEB3959097.1 FkbM family methyltransferase [Streptomyces kunmingensis]